MMTSNFEMALYAQLVCALLTFRLFLFQNVNCFLSSTSQSLSGNSTVSSRSRSRTAMELVAVSRGSPLDECDWSADAIRD